MADPNNLNTVILQQVSPDSIRVNVNGKEEEILRKLDSLQAFLAKSQTQSFQTADKIYNIGTITNANFDFILKQNDFQGLPQELKDNLLTEGDWALSLKQELINQKVPVRNNRTYEHYGWLIETFLQKMSSEVGRATTLRALSFMTEAYQISLYYLCGIELAQVLQQNGNLKNPVFSDFVKMSPENQVLFDYLNFLIISTEVLGENNFMSEIAPFVEELTDTESDLYGVALFLDKTRRQLIQNQLKEDENLPQLIDEYRTALIFWLRELAFLAKYRLVSMKEINIEYHLGSANKEFVHYYGELHGMYEASSVEEDYTMLSVKDAFTYNHSVLLFKGMNIDTCLNEIYQKQNYISLSPIMIDQSVFSDKNTQTPEIFYFTGMNGRNYYFAQYKNELPLGGQKTLASNKMLIVKKENLSQPKLNELFNHLELLLKPLIQQ